MTSIVRTTAPTAGSVTATATTCATSAGATTTLATATDPATSPRPLTQATPPAPTTASVAPVRQTARQPASSSPSRAPACLAATLPERPAASPKRRAVCRPAVRAARAWPQAKLVRALATPLRRLRAALAARPRPCAVSTRRPRRLRWFVSSRTCRWSVRSTLPPSTPTCSLWGGRQPAACTVHVTPWTAGKARQTPPCSSCPSSQSPLSSHAASSPPALQAVSCCSALVATEA
mmetsp:Transcript_170/g.508  ORF Transcript_170/g.508 Transcript_170/m.508 type:complete len:234 (-) Transcript_170:161-862(-)